MNTLETTILLWSICTTAFVALVIYRSHFTRRETAQMFLDDNVQERHLADEAALTRHVNRLRPAMQAATGAFALASVLMIGTYVVQLLPSVRL